MSQLEVSVRNDLADLARLEGRVHEFLAARSVPPAVLNRVDLVLEELLTNTIKYGYPDTAPHEIAVGLALTPGEIVIRLEDDGRAFNPWDVPPPNTASPLEDRPIGGLGIHLVRNVAERVDYQRLDGRNRVQVAVRRDDS